MPNFQGNRVLRLGSIDRRQTQVNTTGVGQFSPFHIFPESVVCRTDSPAYNAQQCRLAEHLTIEKVDQVNGGAVLFHLSDGRSLKITLERILGCDYEVMHDPEPE